MKVKKLIKKVRKELQIKELRSERDNVVAALLYERATKHFPVPNKEEAKRMLAKRKSKIDLSGLTTEELQLLLKLGKNKQL